MARLLLLLVALVLGAVFVLPNTEYGRHLIERETARLSGGTVRIAGLGGRFPGVVTIRRLELADATGPWLTAEGIAVRWRPARLAAGRIDIASLRAARVGLDRLPRGGAGGGAGPMPPLAAAIADLAIDRVDLPATLAGQALILSVSGHLALDRTGQATLGLEIGTPGSTWRIDGTAGAGAIDARIGIDETAEGVLAARAGLGPLTARAALHGPPDALSVALDATAGPVHATASGTLDLPARSATLRIDGQAGALTRLGASWRSATLSARLAGTAEAPDLSATLDAAGLVLPGLPAGRLTAPLVQLDGSIAAARVTLAAHGPPDAVAVTATAQAGAFAAQASGTIDIATLAGSLDATADTGPMAPAGFIAWHNAHLAAHLDGSFAAPAGTATLMLDGAVLPGSVFAGAPLVLRAEAPSAGAIALVLRGAGLEAAGTLDLPGRQATLTSLHAVLRGQAVALRAPARIGFADGVTLDRLSLAGAGATLDIAGRAAPSPDLTATLRALPAALFADADGRIDAAATLKGEAATVRLTAGGVRLRTGPAAALPPASVSLSATRAGQAARIDATASAGPARASLDGTVGLAGQLALQGRLSAPLALLDPLLAGAGRRVRGTLEATGRIGGSLAAPRPSATLRLADGEVQDATLGLRLTRIAAEAGFDGTTLTLSQASARAGQGSVTLAGTATTAGALDLRLSARNATPLASDLLTATLDADLALRGTVPDGLAASGTLAVQRMDVRIPESMPASLPTLNVRRRGERRVRIPPPPGIGLDIAFSVPGRVNVRGRGLDAELGGGGRIGGTSTAPDVTGALALRRGRFTLAGQALTLSTGRLGFDGALPPDPTLDFTATTRSAATTATIAIGGSASAPRITLSSVPELPQDEILSQLLLGQSRGQLSPVQLAQLAAAFAQLTNIGGGFDPLDAIRSGLGLDRLSVGASETGGAKVEAGRTLAPGVYLGVRQGTSAGSSQGTVQIDIGHGLKLEGDVGTPSPTPQPGERTGSGAGLSWEYEW